MVTPASESPDNSHALSRERHVVMMYRNNLLFRRLLPEIELQLRRECNISLERVNFPELTTPPQMTETLEAVFDKSRSDTLYITDVTVRRGIRAMRDLGEPLIDAAHHGVLLDQCLATAVKQIVADELRRPILQRMVATPSAKERAATGELNLRAEKVFFEALLLPLVRAYPNHQFVVVAEKLLHHAPFVTYFGALREAYSAQFGNSDPVIIPELL